MGNTVEANCSCCCWMEPFLGKNLPVRTLKDDNSSLRRATARRADTQMTTYIEEEDDNMCIQNEPGETCIIIHHQRRK